MSSQARKEKSNNTGNSPFGVLLFSSSYVDIESTNTVFSDLMNKCKLPKMSSSLRLFTKPIKIPLNTLKEIYNDRRI